MCAVGGQGETCPRITLLPPPPRGLEATVSCSGQDVPIQCQGRSLSHTPSHPPPAARCQVGQPCPGPLVFLLFLHPLQVPPLPQFFGLEVQGLCPVSISHPLS